VVGLLSALLSLFTLSSQNVKIEFLIVKKDWFFQLEILTTGIIFGKIFLAKNFQIICLGTQDVVNSPFIEIVLQTGKSLVVKILSH
jgi:hypothetical protein